MGSEPFAPLVRPSLAASGAKVQYRPSGLLVEVKLQQDEQRREKGKTLEEKGQGECKSGDKQITVGSQVVGSVIDRRGSVDVGCEREHRQRA